MSIELGPFRLDEPIGRGGMGEVWGGTHVEQGVPVAVKVLTAVHARGESFRAAFRTEAQAMAALDHSGIVLILDMGEIDHAVSRRSDGHLVADSPYLVMERASGGTIASAGLRWPFARLRRALLELLDALAHAHARGVVHKDIKPANILVATDVDLRPGLKLTDFGIAHAMTDDDRSGFVEDRIAGSPHYMAPEQFLGRWREFGPWTDLYALGVTAYEVATGYVPFDGTSMIELVRAHSKAPIPRVTDHRPDLPPAFADWVAQLMAKAPEARFASAADAAWALLQIPATESPEPTDGGATFIQERGALETLSFEPVGDEETRLLGGPTPSTDPPHSLLRSGGGKTARATLPTIEVQGNATASAVPAPGSLPAELRPFRDTPPIPPTWRRPATARKPMALIGAGLRLFGLRPVPFTGRSEERDRMWTTLQEAARTRAPRAVVVRGASGNGKSRLVEWVAERATEVGAAHIMTAVHSPISGPNDGVARMIARHLRAVGLEREDARRQIRRRLGPDADLSHYDRSAIATLLGAPDPSSLVAFATREQRWIVVGRLLADAARERPVLVWLDDVQWGLDSLEMAVFLLETLADAPVLFVLTVRDEALATRRVEADTLGQLVAREDCETIELGPLSPRDHGRLTESLLGLESGLAAQIAARTGGNPLFAVQLVGDWVERGLLVPGKRGFVLRSDARVELPDDLHQVWAARVEAVLAPYPPSARVALEVAAILGQDVDADEWRQVVEAVGGHIADGLVGDLVDARLARRLEGGWSFTHGMLRESIERRAREQGRSEQLHAACAEMIALVGDEDAPDVAERLGRHRLAAGQPERAAEPLRIAASKARGLSDYPRAHALIQQYVNALRAAGVPDDDPRWGLAHTMRSEVFAVQGSFDDAIVEANRALDLAREHGWVVIEGVALTRLGAVSRQRSELGRAQSLYEQGVARLRQKHADAELAAALRGLGWVSVLRADLAAASEQVAEARNIFEALGDEDGIAGCLRSLGDIRRNEDRLEDARQCFADARDINRRLGSTRGVSECVHGIAEVDRLTGNLAEAEAGYRESIALDESIGARAPTIPRLNLGLCQLARKRYAEARSTLQHVLDTFLDAQQFGYAGCAHVCLLPALAGIGDWDAFDAHLFAARGRLERAQLVDPDIAGPAQQAGQMAAERGQPARALDALALAEDQWSALKNTARVDEVRELVALVSA